jgi:UDP-N-acetyl-D-glucosamine dehydrogenase
MTLHGRVTTPPTPRLTRTTTIAVIGLGYVGLPTALAMYAGALRVIGLEVSADRVERIRHGEPDLVPDDRERLHAARRDPDRFMVTTDVARAAEADAVIVCVPTPVDASLTPDLTWLRVACATAVACARPGQVLILTSTSYVGCTRDLLSAPLSRRGLSVGQDVFVAFSPERINPGSDAFDLASVPRVVGGVTRECARRAADVLNRICPVTHLVSSLEAAEMVKLLENTFRAVNIALANEVADVCQGFDLNPVEVINAAATKPFGFMPFYPGPGVGGHCIPCDPHYLLWQLRREHVHPPVISAAMQDISTRPARIVERATEVLDRAGKTLSGSHVLVAGLAYKPNVADTRESPALDIIDGLARRASQVSVYDPIVPSVRVGDRVYASVSGELEADSYDLVVMCCRHDSMGDLLLGGDPLVLDATFSLPPNANTHLP